MNTLTYPSPRAERGAALITGLIFMVVLTLISLAALRTTLLEEKMSGNARDIDLAFQSAEAALRAGEGVMNGASLPSFGATGPYLTASSGRSNTTYWTQTFGWGAADTVTLPSVPPGSYAAPQFVIEQIPSGVAGGFSLKSGPVTEAGMYRITARGTGGNPNTHIYLQETYRR